jgi:hypothetical protein
MLIDTCGSHPVWPRDSFGPTLTLARKYFGPEYFGPEILRPETTLARKILWPAYILWPRNNFGPENTSARLYTSARKYFGPIDFGPIDFGPLHFGPGTKLSKVSFFIICLGGALE